MSYPLRVLILTDHAGHSAENSLYALVSQMRRHPSVASVHITSRSEPSNPTLWNPSGAGAQVQRVVVKELTEDLPFDPSGQQWSRGLTEVPTNYFSLVWLRLPPPLSTEWLLQLQQCFPPAVILNRPTGIIATNSKAFLLQFPELIAPSWLCRSIADIDRVRAGQEVVLKPLRDYGGRGLVRIQGDRVWRGTEATTYAEFRDSLASASIEYLAVHYLKNVSAGDKRIVVADGQIIGASLRLPRADSWLCNVSAGGRSAETVVDADEQYIIQTIAPHLDKLGIVLYGVDTLVGDNGRRILSEINTTSIGGIPQIERLSGSPAVARVVDAILSNALAVTE